MPITDLLTWCQLHDWGQGAYYSDGRVCGLLDVVLHDNGDVTADTISLPADYGTIRVWAGY